MKPLVLASIEDASGDRCVDIVQISGTDFGFSECRRDPEDSHGWRRLSGITSGFGSAEAAHDAAGRAVVWLGRQA